MGGIKVLIADGSPIFGKMFAQAAADVAGDASVACASNWNAALGKIRRTHYDIVVLDSEISETSAADLVPEIARVSPGSVVLLAARPSPENGALFADVTAKGVASCMIKPINDSYRENFAAVRGKMADVVEILRGRPAEQGVSPRLPAIHDDSLTAAPRFHPEIVLMAASTGGPAALERILSSLCTSFPLPVLIVQHVLSHFTETLAMELNRRSALRVKVADRGEVPVAGTVYLAPGGTHMRLDAEKRIAFDGSSPPRNGVRPAADALFESVAEVSPWTGVLTVVLTGMGRDGARGLASLKEKQRCVCLAQSEKTCVIYGMPRAAVEGGLADRILDLGEIAREMERFCLPPERAGRMARRSR